MNLSQQSTKVKFAGASQKTARHLPEVCQAGPLARWIDRRQFYGADLVYVDDRPVWMPGFPIQPYLDGTLPGDYGFDPLALAKPDKLNWYVQAELQNGRWAMLACAGILFPPLFAKIGGVDFPEWFDVGKVYVEQPNAIPFGTLFTAQLALFNWIEMKRYYDYVSPGSQADGSFLGVREGLEGQGAGYPGGKFFDPLGFARGSPEQTRMLKVKEIANGRLAMISFLGYFFQLGATGKGPINNLFDHLASPTTNTFVSNGLSLPFLY